MKSFSLILVLGLVFGELSFFGNEIDSAIPESGQYDRYFPTPQAAVIGITELLEAEDWGTLAAYYDLTASSIDKTTLKNGNYFTADMDHTDTQSASMARREQPFAPGSQYWSTKPVGNDEFEVSLTFEVEQEDGTVQRGLDTLYLKAYPEGYQILPR